MLTTPSALVAWRTLLAAAAVATALSFLPRVAAVAAWALVPCALSAFFAADAAAVAAQQSTSSSFARSGRLRFAALFVATQAAASTVALWGVLQGPGVPPAVGRAALLPLSFLVWVCLALPFLLHVAYAARFPDSPLAVLVCPVAWTAAWCLIGAESPLGAFASPASSQATWRPVAQLAAVLGGDGIVFLLAWPGAALSTCWAGVLSPRAHACRHLAVAAVATLLCVGVGALRIRRGPSPAALAAAGEALRVSCLVRDEDALPPLPEATLWRRTSERIAAGDDIVLWSETALRVDGVAAERALLARAEAAAAAGWAYVGVTYELWPDASDEASPRRRLAENVLVLLRPGIGPVNASVHGAAAFRTVKAHPVPIVERGFAAGPRRLSFEAAPWGLTSAAICFDNDFPALMRQAGRRHASLVLQTSQTWGPTSFRVRHFLGNGLRAVESGYTLLRCSSSGVSGAVGPRLEPLAWVPTGAEGVVTLTLPPPSALHAATFYPRGGWLFGWACVAAAAAAAAALALPARFTARADAVQLAEARPPCAA